MKKYHDFFFLHFVNSELKMTVKNIPELLTILEHVEEFFRLDYEFKIKNECAKSMTSDYFSF